MIVNFTIAFNEKENIKCYHLALQRSLTSLFYI